MELLERYLIAVKSFLPPAQQDDQDDIVEELSANLQAQMDDRSVALGRPLTDEEQEAILRQHGHPMLVAARYQTHQGGVVFGRQLIGPTLFPLYLRVLWFTIGVSLVIYLLVHIALALAGHATTVGETVNTALVQLIALCAIVTGIFIAANTYLPAMDWNARRPPTMPSMFRQGQLKLYLGAVVEIAFIFLFYYWLWLLFTRPSLLFGAAADPYTPGPIWQRVVWPVALIALVSVAQPIMTLIRPAWVRARSVWRLALGLAVLGVLVFLLLGNQWVVFAQPGSTSASALATINTSVYYALLSTAVGVTIVALFEAWKLLRTARTRPA